jgi:germination protein M
MSKNKVKPLVTAVFASTLLLSGCGLFGKEVQKKVDPPKQVTVTDTNPTKETTGKSEEVEGTVKTELYLINKDGFVVPQTLTLPKTTSVAKQALEHLVANGPVTDMLPNDFRAVLPEEQISVNIKDGVAVVFSKEFKNYQPEDEKNSRIYHMVTYPI